MASEAGRTGVLIACLTSVMAVSNALAVRMAVDAFKSGEVPHYVMACGAGVPDGTVPARIDREVLAVVIPGRWRPRRRTMAGPAIGGKYLARMIRAGRAGIACLMACVTGGCGANVPGSVAGYARRCEMRAGQRKSCCPVIEGGRSPGRCRMALGAIVIEIVRHVVRIYHSRELSLVTTVARCRRSGVAGRVTGHAGYYRMGTGKRENRRAVVKRRRIPGGCGVTPGAIVIEVVGDMVRVNHRRELRLVAAVAGRWCSCKTGNVARFARC